MAGGGRGGSEAAAGIITPRGNASAPMPAGRRQSHDAHRSRSLTFRKEHTPHDQFWAGTADAAGGGSDAPGYNSDESMTAGAATGSACARTAAAEAYLGAKHTSQVAADASLLSVQCRHTQRPMPSAAAAALIRSNPVPRHERYSSHIQQQRCHEKKERVSQGSRLARETALPKR
jgi:hypothetical protein